MVAWLPSRALRDVVRGVLLSVGGRALGRAGGGGGVGVGERVCKLVRSGVAADRVAAQCGDSAGLGLDVGVDVVFCAPGQGAAFVTAATGCFTAAGACDGQPAGAAAGQSDVDCSGRCSDRFTARFGARLGAGLSACLTALRVACVATFTAARVSANNVLCSERVQREVPMRRAMGVSPQPENGNARILPVLVVVAGGDLVAVVIPVVIEVAAVASALGAESNRQAPRGAVAGARWCSKTIVEMTVSRP